MTRTKKKDMSIKQTVKIAKSPEMCEQALTKLVVGVVHGAKLDSVECLALVKHVQTLDEIASQMRTLCERGII